MVISGGHFKPDALKPKEAVSLLLDDAEMECKFVQKQAEKKADEQKRRRERKRKPTETPTVKIDRSYSPQWTFSKGLFIWEAGRDVYRNGTLKTRSSARILAKHSGSCSHPTSSNVIVKMAYSFGEFLEQFKKLIVNSSFKLPAFIVLVS